MDPLTLDLTHFPVLTTGRLVLRELVMDDAQRLFEMRSDARVMEHIGRPRATSMKDAKDLISRIAQDRGQGQGITWAVQWKDDPRLIGTMGYYRLKLEHHTAEVGYMLHPDHWRQGVMSEALKEAVIC